MRLARRPPSKNIPKRSLRNISIKRHHRLYNVHAASRRVATITITRRITSHNTVRIRTLIRITTRVFNQGSLTSSTANRTSSLMMSRLSATIFSFTKGLFGNLPQDIRFTIAFRQNKKRSNPFKSLIKNLSN